MNILAAMAAIALTLGISGNAEIWTLTDQPEANWTPAEVVVEIPAACVTIPITVNEVGTPLAGFAGRTYTGGLTSQDVQASTVGHFLNVGFDQYGLDSWDMVLTSIDVTGLTEVSICR